MGRSGSWGPGKEGTRSPDSHSVRRSPPVRAPQICLSFLSAYATHAGSQVPRGGKPRLAGPTCSPLSRTSGGRAGADAALYAAALELQRAGYLHAPRPTSHMHWCGGDRKPHRSLLWALEEWEPHSTAGAKAQGSPLALSLCSVLESDSDLWGQSQGSTVWRGSAHSPPSRVTAGVSAGAVASWRLYRIRRPPPAWERFAGAGAVFRFCQNLFKYKFPRRNPICCKT